MLSQNDGSMLCKYTDTFFQDRDGSHDLFHAFRVCANACKISTVDTLLTTIAALLHDTCDHKYATQKVQLVAMRSVLTSILTDVEIDHIVGVVANTSFSRYKAHGEPTLPPQALVIWRQLSDCDMLEALGVVGCIRTLLYQGFRNAKLPDGLSYIQDELIPKCVLFMHSEVARKEANLRTNSMVHFVTWIQNDVQGETYAQKLIEWGSKRASFMEVLSEILRCWPVWIRTELLREFDFAPMCEITRFLGDVDILKSYVKVCRMIV